MEDWLALYAGALNERLDAGAAEVGLVAGGVGTVLDLARQVAHSTERRYAPLATFMAGCYVALRVGEGVDATTALEEAVAAARGVLPPPAPPEPA